MKEYGHVVEGGDKFAVRVRDATELLASNGGPVAGGPLDLQVAYDPPCHLLHAPTRRPAARTALRGHTVAPPRDDRRGE